MCRPKGHSKHCCWDGRTVGGRSRPNSLINDLTHQPRFNPLKNHCRRHGEEGKGLSKLDVVSS